MGAKPTVTPRWASTITVGDDLQVPASGKQNIGYVDGEQPPYEYENWLRKTTWEWADWLDSAIDDNGSTAFDIKRSIVSVTESTQATVGFEIGDSTVAGQFVYADFRSSNTYSDYGTRIARSAGDNGGFSIIHRGTGNFDLNCSESAAIQMFTTGSLRAQVSDSGMFLNVPITAIDTDSGFNLDIDGSSNARITFDTSGGNDYILYSRTANRWQFHIADDWAYGLSRNTLSIEADGSNSLSLEIGSNPTADFSSNIDLKSDTTYPDYGLRIIRTSGANGNGVLQNRGTGHLRLQYEDNGGDIDFYDHNDARMVLMDSGGVDFDVPIRSIDGDANFAIEIDGVSDARITVDSGDYMAYDRGADNFAFVAGGALAARIGSGITEIDGLADFSLINAAATLPRILMASTTVYFERNGIDLSMVNGAYTFRINNSGLGTFNGTLAGGGTGVAGTYSIEATTDAAKPGGGSWSVPSDKRIKKQIKKIDDGLSVIMKLRPVRFSYIEKFKEWGAGVNTQHGYIAQEFEDVLPEYVKDVETCAVDGKPIKVINSSAVEQLLVSAVQEISERLEKVERRR